MGLHKPATILHTAALCRSFSFLFINLAVTPSSESKPLMSPEFQMAALSKMANGSFAFIWVGKSTENISKFSYMDNAWKIIAAQSICRTFNNRMSCSSLVKILKFF